MGMSLFVGSNPLASEIVWQAITHYDAADTNHLIVYELRIPRTLIAVFGGASLGLAGALMQSLTRNALAEPGTLGVNAGAAAGVVLGLLIVPATTITVYVWFAFIGAGIAAVTVHRLGSAGETGVNSVRLVLAGAGLSIMVGSLTTIVVLSNANQVFNSMRAWVTGSLDGRGWAFLPVVVIGFGFGLVMCCFLAQPLNAIALGTSLGKALGVNIRATRNLTNTAIIILAGGTTAAIGPIGFVGLAAPHIARIVVGPDHRWVLPYSAIIAGLLLLIADIIGRVVLSPNEIGVGIMTAFIGAPFFIWLVRKGKVSGL